ncbi:MAG TPA: mismatch-specific DNA-glycosylase [Micropepsaceae bacterium]|nr:mismatch-specific DNA-glycosylase [Micropepsaceae bacterium]
MSAEKLPDLLASGLDVVFVGTAAGERSAKEKTYYAHPGNRFWRTLAEIRLTSRKFEPSEYRKLLEHGVGFTDLCKTESGMDHAVSRFDLAGFEQKILKYRPRALAFTSKKAGSIWLHCSTRDICCGKLPNTRENFPTVFVLPSPSGAASGHWKIEPWQKLADWVKRSGG